MTETIINTIIRLWVEVLFAKGTITKPSLRTYATSVNHFIDAGLSYNEYLGKLKNKRASNTYGHDKTAIDQFLYFLLVMGILGKHPNPKYKATGWDRSDNLRPWLPKPLRYE